MEITFEHRMAADKAWKDYSRKDVFNQKVVPWRDGPISKIAFIDGYLTAIEYPPEKINE